MYRTRASGRARGAVLVVLLTGLGTAVCARAAEASSAACLGVAVTPASQLQALIDAKPAGTTFCFAAGVYRAADTLRTKDRDTFDGAARQAVLDGGNAAQFGFYGDAVGAAPSDVTIRGFVIRNYATPLQRGAIQDYAGPGWVIRDNDIEHNAAAAVATGDGVRVVGNVLSNNAQEGFSAHGVGGRYVGNTIAGNNAALTCDAPNGCWARWEAGGGKAWNTTGLRLVDNVVDANGGPGLWIDTNNIGTVIDGNTITRNWAAGVEEEISYNFLITGNDVEHNGGAGALGGGERSGWAWDAGINVRRSQGIAGFTSLIAANRLVDNYNGITLADSPPSGCTAAGEGSYGPCRVANVLVRNNDVTMAQGAVGAYDDGPTDAVFSAAANVRFTGNRYTVAAMSPPAGGPSDAWFAWANQWASWAQWQSYGNDRKGQLTVAPV